MRTYRKQRKEYRKLGNGYYHFCTDGWKAGNIFNTVGQYAYGMILIGLITLLYDVKVYEFILMPNHIHIIMSGTGDSIVNAFSYLKRKLNLKLSSDGYMMLPEDYGFKMVPITSPEQMRDAIIYINRNAYEKQIATPGGYPWCSGWLHYSLFSKYIRGKKVGEMNKLDIETLTGRRMELPSTWEFHPTFGLLPQSFVDTHFMLQLFKGPKDYFTHLIKDYEAIVSIARTIDEELEYDEVEIQDILTSILRADYQGRPVYKLSGTEKGRLSVTMSHKYNIQPKKIAEALKLDPHIVYQFLRAKDYGNNKHLK